MNRTVLSVVVCALALVACRRNRDTQRGSTNLQPLGAPIGSVVSPPSTQPPACPDGYTVNKSPPWWCIALPEGYKAVREASDGMMGYVEYAIAPETLRVFFTDVPYDPVLKQARVYMFAKGWAVSGEGDVPGGHWFASRDADGQGHYIILWHGRKPFTMRCDAGAAEDSDAFARLTDACRSLLLP